MNPAQYRLIKTDHAILERVDLIALSIRRDYVDKKPILIGILNGSFIFMADLVRALSHPTKQNPIYPEIDFIKVSSYKQTRSTGKVNMVNGLSCLIENRHVILVDDIVDTGLTMRFVKEYLTTKKPTSVSVAALLVKHQHKVDYPGFHVGEEFVFGYGLDVSGEMRSLGELRAL